MFSPRRYYRDATCDSADAASLAALPTNECYDGSIYTCGSDGKTYTVRTVRTCSQFFVSL